LNALGHEAVHVAHIALSTASDRKIWDQAIASDAVLITKDQDFVSMRALSRRGGR
jgi:predicted nuclease of predicted toxin-antitoxin system